MGAVEASSITREILRQSGPMAVRNSAAMLTGEVVVAMARLQAVVERRVDQLEHAGAQGHRAVLAPHFHRRRS